MSFTRQGFEKSLEELQSKILRMGNLVEQAIADSVQALKTQDVELAQKVTKGDNAIDQMELEIEDFCIMLIATQQPMASDLRKIGTAFKIITDLERMGDYASGIAKVAVRLAGQPLVKPLVDVPKMAALTQKMVKKSLDSYVNSDVELANSMNGDDDMIDSLYREVHEELVELMARKPETIGQAVHLLFVAKNLERIGDHATNIGEGVIYLVTGERADLNR